jgi:hypothetical protein
MAEGVILLSAKACAGWPPRKKARHDRIALGGANPGDAYSRLCLGHRRNNACELSMSC